MFSVGPPPNYFSLQNIDEIDCESFPKLYDFMIYQHVSKRAKILLLATFRIARLCKQFNQVYTINFYAML